MQATKDWGPSQNREFLNLGALKFSYLNKIHIFQCTEWKTYFKG